MFQRGLTPPDPFGERGILETARTQDSMSLRAMAELGPVVVVLLPALDRADAWLKAVQDARPGLEGEGVRLVLVHMEGDEVARALLERFDLHYLARIADPERALYAHFEAGARDRGCHALKAITNPARIIVLMVTLLQ